MLLRNAQEKLIAHQTRLARLGFTLMEILVVVAIIVALAGIGGFFLLGQLNTSKIDVAKIQAKELKKACQTFYIRHKQFPGQLDDLVNPNLPGGPILEDPKALLDPWDQPYQLTKSPLGTPMIISNGGGAGVISSD